MCGVYTFSCPWLSFSWGEKKENKLYVHVSGDGSHYAQLFLRNFFLFIYLNWQIKLNVEPFYALDHHLQLFYILSWLFIYYGIVSTFQAEERHCEILGRLLCTAKLVAKQEGLDDGFRIVINDGRDGGKHSSPCHCSNIGQSDFIWFIGSCGVCSVFLLRIGFWQANQFTTFMCTSLGDDRWAGPLSKMWKDS